MLYFKALSRYTYSILNIVVTNLAPYMGLLWLGWTPEVIFVCYALETVVIGSFNIFKLLMVNIGSKVSVGRRASPADDMGIAAIPAFIFSYGLAAIIQFYIFLGIFSKIGAGNVDWFWQSLFSIISRHDIYLVLTFLTISSLFSLVTGFIIPRRYVNLTMGEQVAEPFVHVFISQAAVFLGAILFLGSGNAFMILVLLTLVKVTIEIFLLRHNPIELFAFRKDPIG